MPAEIVITRDQILRHAQTLPAAPQVLAGLCELLEDINTDLDQLASEIRVDPALSARVIRLSNSVAFGGRGAVASVDEAVNRVGFAEIVGLVGVATAAGLVDRALAAYGIAAERMRESLLLHALASEELARETTVEPRAAYTGGLLRAVGMMVLERVARGLSTPLEPFNPERFSTYAEWEQRQFGLTAAEVATMILDEWRFPPETVLAVEHQHLLSDAGADDLFAHVLNLAGGIVAAHGLALPGEEKCWSVTPEKLFAAGLDEAQWEAARERAITTFERQRMTL